MFLLLTPPDGSPNVTEIDALTFLCTFSFLCFFLKISFFNFRLMLCGELGLTVGS